MEQVDSELRQFASKRQAQVFDAVQRCGSNRKAAIELGLGRRTVDESMNRLRKNAAIRGYSPEHGMVHSVPDGFKLKGVSMRFPATETAPAQWVLIREDAIRQKEIIQEAVRSFIEDCPQLTVPDAPDIVNSDIIPWIEIGDAHLGLLCHAAEVGENFDLKIGAHELCGAISILIDEMPNCERMVVNDLGDFTHYQDFTATSESGHVFDFDTRYPKMIKIASRVMRFIVDKALSKAKHVDVIINQGNHSRSNDIWMAEILEVAYGHTGRVHILNNGCAFIAYRMGQTLVMTHHSDKCKPKDLANVMTTDFRKDYGETKFHYIDIGHIHHGMVLTEHPGVIIESFNQLTATDKWAHDIGFRSRKCISVIKRSKKYGEVGRRLLGIEEVRDRIGVAYGAKAAHAKQVYTV